MIILSTLPTTTIDRVNTVLCRYDLVEGGQILKTEIESIRIRLYESDEMDSLLKSVGFKEVKRLSAYGRTEPLSEDDSIIIYECMK